MNPGTAPSIYSLQEKNVKSSRAIIANNVLPDKEMVLAPKFVPFHKLDSCTGFIAVGDLI